MMAEGGIIEIRGVTRPGSSNPVWHLAGTLQILVAPSRFELETPVLSGQCSTTELRGKNAR